MITENSHIQIESLYSTILNESLDAILILDIETQKFLMFNKKALELYEYTEDEFKNITPKDLTLEFTTDEKMREKQFEILEKGWDKFTSKHKTKSHLPIDVFMKSKKIENKETKNLLYITIHNLSDERIYEKEFETIFKSSKDGISIIDLNAKILNFNYSFQKMLGFSNDELMKKNFFDLSPKNENEKITSILKKVSSEDVVENFETKFITKENSILTVYMSLNLLPDRKRILITIKNITDIKLKEAEEKLQSMHKLISNIGHHWRQPLNMITTVSSAILLRNELLGNKDKELIDDLNIVINEAKKISSTIDLFDETITKNYKFNKYYLKEIIEEAIQSLATPIKENKINIVVNISEELSIQIYKELFLSSVLNILINSIESFDKNFEKKKYIFIEAKSINNQISLSIKDNAQGIKEEYLNKIFNPYFTTKHQKQGKGLGLTHVMKNLKNIHNFKVEVFNETYTYENKTQKGLNLLISF